MPAPHSQRSSLMRASTPPVRAFLDSLKRDLDIEIIAPLLVFGYFFGDITIRSIVHPIF
jgi:hypothetical protein